MITILMAITIILITMYAMAMTFIQSVIALIPAILFIALVVKAIQYLLEEPKDPNEEEDAGTDSDK